MEEMPMPERGIAQTVYENKYFRVYTQTADFGRIQKKYYVTDFGDKASILIFNKDALLMVRQYRLLIDRYSWELPGGRIDKSESPEEAAIRETEEETGIRARNIRPLLDYSVGLEAIQARSFLFYTDDFEVAKPFVPDLQEVVSIAWVPFERCLRMIEQGEIVDNITLIALLYYQNSVINKKEKVYG